LRHIYAEGGYAAGSHGSERSDGPIAASERQCAMRWESTEQMQKLGPQFNVCSTSMFGAALIAAGPDFGFLRLIGWPLWKDERRYQSALQPRRRGGSDTGLIAGVDR